MITEAVKLNEIVSIFSYMFNINQYHMFRTCKLTAGLKC